MGECDEIKQTAGHGPGYSCLLLVQGCKKKKCASGAKEKWGTKRLYYLRQIECREIKKKKKRKEEKEE